MKKISILLVLVALGVASQSCNDQDFSDVEDTVLKGTTYDVEGDQKDITPDPWGGD